MKPNTSRADQLLVADDRAADAAPLPVEILGRRMDHEVGAELERLLQRRRAEAVVDREQHAALVRDVGERADIGDRGQRIRRRLEERDARVGAHRRAPGFVVVGPHIRNLDAELHHVAIEQRDRGAEHAVRTDDVIAGLQQRHARREDRRHAGAGADARRAAFHRRQALLEAAHGRIREARIDVALLGLREPRGRLGGIAKHVARGGEDRFRVLAFVRAQLTGADGQRCKMMSVGHGPIMHLH